jgi:hypothetical protein
VPNVHLALVHYPVVNKSGETIAAALTALDLHDIARAAKTYGARCFYVVTPLHDQATLVDRLVAHWTRGAGAVYNPARKEALELVKVRESLEAVTEELVRSAGGTTRPCSVVTSARSHEGAIDFGSLRRTLHSAAGPFLLVFGTAWGLAEEVVRNADHILAPIRGPADYNHLSVRCAAAIILDRLLGERT